jgi:ligand-binding SRPBCC domain-containing protein
MASMSITNHPLGGYRLQSEIIIPRSIEEVFAFFSDAANLERLTPPWLNFQILTPQPIEMRPGRLIDYKLRIRGVPVRWQSEITEWNPPYSFADESRRGPYRYWRHQHRFDGCDGGTRVVDDAHYDVPGGALVHWLVVKRDVRKIFEYRLRTLQEIFPAIAPASEAVPTS